MGLRGRICAIDDDGAILHVELKNKDGQTVAGVYELIGWTKPPRDVKAKAELDLWVPPKTKHPVA